MTKEKPIDVAEIIREVRLRIKGQPEEDEPDEQELIALRKEAYKQYLAEEVEKRRQTQTPIIPENSRPEKEPTRLCDFMRQRGWSQ